jgi:hypothetical protein
MSNAMSSAMSNPMGHTTSGDERMVDRPDPRGASDPNSTPAERRRRVALRRLVDEMLDEIRAAANEENWNAVSRSQAEMDLARIMSQVRREAVKRPGSDDGRRSSASKRGTKAGAKRGRSAQKSASTGRGTSAKRSGGSTTKRSGPKKKSARKKAKSR